MPQNETPTLKFTRVDQLALEHTVRSHMQAGANAETIQSTVNQMLIQHLDTGPSAMYRMLTIRLNRKLDTTVLDKSLLAEIVYDLKQSPAKVQRREAEAKMITTRQTVQDLDDATADIIDDLLSETIQYIQAMNERTDELLTLM